MKLHELKIKAEYMQAIALGRKKFELRKNDRDYQEGDLIKFNVIYGKGLTVTNEYGFFYESKGVNFYKSIDLNSELYKITYVLKDVPQYGLDAEYCILGIKKLDLKEV